MGSRPTTGIIRFVTLLLLVTQAVVLSLPGADDFVTGSVFATQLPFAAQFFVAYMLFGFGAALMGLLLQHRSVETMIMSIAAYGISLYAYKKGLMFDIWPAAFLFASLLVWLVFNRFDQTMRSAEGEEGYALTASIHH